MSKQLKVLVMCEESQAVCKAFRALGHIAFSSDLKPCSGGFPEYHLQMDCFKAFDLVHPDLVVAHPPCTMLSVVSSVRLYDGSHTLQDVEDARNFFLRCLNLPCDRIAVENPRPLKVAQLPQASQYIQPYMFGDDYTKLTGLWLKGLPLLFPESLSAAGKRTGFPSWVSAGSFNKDGSRRQVVGLHNSPGMRSKTFPGIARAMAEQWGGYVDER